jgi:catechol 2,3-dioxygenase-like lactoylglutathione lyase family enzyme
MGMMMDATWHHVAMAVSDMGRSLEFYCDLLGFEVDWERKNYGGSMFSRVVGLPDAAAHVVMLKGYGARIELFSYHSPEGERIRSGRQCDFGLTHFALSVKDIHSLFKGLEKEGVCFNCPPQNLRAGVWATYMKDPEGNTIELVEYE